MRVSALLAFNPELQRGIWLELTPSRLISMPLVLALLLGGADSIRGPQDAVGFAKAIIWLLLVLWGSRLAAESIDAEVAGRTWDLQRLSAQKPWALTLGKLFGGTIFVWYGAALCLGAVALLRPAELPEIVWSALQGGLTAQSTAMFVALVLNRFGGQGRRTHTTFAQVLGIFAVWQNGLMSVTGRIPQAFGQDTIVWYGHAMPGLLTAIEIMSVAWLIFGAMRIVRRELGFIDGPLGWSLYTLYAIFLAAGFVPHASQGTSTGWEDRVVPLAGILASQSLAWVISVTLTYLAVLAVPVSRADLRKLSAAYAARDWRAIWRNLPVWVPSAMAATVVVLALTAKLAASDITQSGALMPLAALGFLMRDIALIYLLRLTYRGRTAMALVVMFLLLYGVLPFFLGHLPGGFAMSLFYPGFYPGLGRALTPWIEAAIAIAAVLRIWQLPPAPAR
jgi:hypothetical protein